MPDSLVVEFANLFQGRTDAVGTEAGGCIRLPGEWAVQRAIDLHLGHGGKDAIGIYPMRLFPMAKATGSGEFVRAEDATNEAEWRVHWGCIDFDEGEEISLVHARNVRTALQQLGLTSWIERSRSKGFHVWLFADEWVPARTMRRALLAACQLVDAPTKEINPKQEELNDDQLGNYVRLSHPGGLNEITELESREPGVVGGTHRGRGQLLHHQGQQAAQGGNLPADDGRGHRAASRRHGGRWWQCVCGRAFQATPAPHSRQSDLGSSGAPVWGDREPYPRRVVLDEQGNPLCVYCFVRSALVARASESKLERAAALFRDKPRTFTSPPAVVDTDTDPIKRLSGLARKILTEGPKEGADRSRTLWKLATRIYDDGTHTFEEALDLLVRADLAWGKFMERPDGERYLRGMMEKVWGE